MYSEKLVCVVKVKGHVLREHGDTVHLPFGSEYSLKFKNLNTVRALITVKIDGVDATDGTRLIVPANGTIELERFIKNRNLNEGNRFKFIERTAKIEQHRGIGMEDGLIQILYEFEKDEIRQQSLQEDYFFPVTAAGTGSRVEPPTWPGVTRGWLSSGGLHGFVLDSYNMNASFSEEGVENTYFNATSATEVPMKSAKTSTKSDLGITVPGSVSKQRFTEGAWFPTDGVQHTLVFKLVGAIKGKVVEQPVTVKTKAVCSTCGTTNKSSSKFCRECGTSLTLF